MQNTREVICADAMFVGGFEGKGPLQRHRHRWEDIKIIRCK
jgi:hypothetical protein